MKMQTGEGMADRTWSSDGMGGVFCPFACWKALQSEGLGFKLPASA